MTHIDQSGQSQPIKLVNPEDGSVSDTTVRGIVMAADVKGQVPVVGAIAADPSTPLTAEDEDKASVVALDAKWQTPKELAPVRELRSAPRISPSGKYLAFQSRTAEAETYAITVLCTDGKEHWKIAQSALPLAVTDAGAVLGIDMAFKPGSTLWFCPKGSDKPAELGKGIRAATVVGDMAYCVFITDANAAVMKTLKLPAAP